MCAMSAQSENGSPTSQRERQRIETRERLFQAAVEEFRRVGFSEAQIPAIAEAAGVVRGTFYFHFPSKEHVLLELVERREDEIAAALLALRGSATTVEQVLSGLLDAMEPPGGEDADPELVREIVAMQLRTPRDPAAAPRKEVILDALASLLGDLAGRGEVRTDLAAEPLAALVMTSVYGMTIARGASPGDPRHPTREQLVAVLQSGLRAQADPAASADLP